MREHGTIGQRHITEENELRSRKQTECPETYFLKTRGNGVRHKTHRWENYEIERLFYFRNRYQCRKNRRHRVPPGPLPQTKSGLGRYEAGRNGN